MEHGARLSTSRVMAIAFIFMSVLIVLSLSVNVIQGVNNYRLQNEQRTAVTCAEPEKKPARGKRPRLTNPCL